MNKTTYYVQFKDKFGAMREENVQARNNSAAVEKIKQKYEDVSIYKSGKFINKKRHF